MNIESGLWVGLAACGLGALGWALAAWPLQVYRSATRSFMLFNAWFMVSYGVWLEGGSWPSLANYAYPVALALMVTAFQWLCLGLHRLYDLKPSYVVSPMMLPLLLGTLFTAAWLDGSGRSASMAAVAACMWLLSVSIQQSFPAMRAHAGKSMARWSLWPFMLAVVVWLLGLAEAAGSWLQPWLPVHLGGVVHSANEAAGGRAVDVLMWCITGVLVNVGLVALVVLRLVDKIRELSTEDDLTGAMNGRTFMALLRDERERLTRQSGPQVLLIAELDQLHALTKQLGFKAGDAALRHVTQVIGRHLRKTDRLGLSPNSELLLYLPNTPQVGAILVAERTQAAVKANPLLWKGQAVQLSLSIGLSLRESAEVPCETLVEQAREAVQKALRDGGARTRMARERPVNSSNASVFNSLPASRPLPKDPSTP